VLNVARASRSTRCTSPSEQLNEALKVRAPSTSRFRLKDGFDRTTVTPRSKPGITAEGGPDFSGALTQRSLSRD